MEGTFFVTNADLLVEFVQYFGRTWIGTTFRRRKIQPSYTIDLWNRYHSVQEDLPKANNSCEEFHNAFSSILGDTNFTFYKQIDSLEDQ